MFERLWRYLCGYGEEEEELGEHAVSSGGPPPLSPPPSPPPSPPLSPPPLTTLVGIGSLVSESSAARSFSFCNFRIGEVRGWRRTFSQANWVNTAHGWGSAARGTTAALAMVRCDADFVSRVALLDVNAEELPGFYEREAGYSIVTTDYCEGRGPEGGAARRGVALMCAACADDAEADTLWAPGGAMERHCAGSEYVAAWMRSSLRPLWPPAGAHLLPAPGYLRLCAAAHRRAGLLDHFLDSTLLHDGVTTLRAHCERDEGARRAIASLDEEEAAGSDEEAASMHGDARGALSRSSGHGVTLEP